ncbi:hypothetical protein HCN44_004924 [Aphidius gifuensis]|uniref:DUF4773 domain-containing protein n=2 Tax=Aphidius gifuensis TaxID=684658 RepID=A0A834XSE3_APHGI|nr:hypothetical protein HCN44_004924 [Aphidius gifuensis]
MGPKSFLIRKTSSVGELRCSCPNVNLCNCCQMVTLMYSLTQKNLCANFMYTQNGLNVEMSLNSFIVKAATISTFRPNKICSKVPGALFSSVCINILELNSFPRSLTVCPRLDITSKSQEWKLTYTCISISTELSSTTKIPTGIMAGGIMITPNQGNLLILPIGGQQIGTTMTTMKPVTMSGGQMGLTTTQKPMSMMMPTESPKPGTMPGAQMGMTTTQKPMAMLTGGMSPPGQGAMGMTTTQKPMTMAMPTGGMSPPGQGSMPPKVPTMGMTTLAVPATSSPGMPAIPGAMTTPKPLANQQSRESLTYENFETIILHSPDSNDRSKFFPSRLPPALQNNNNLTVII